MTNLRRKIQLKSFVDGEVRMAMYKNEEHIVVPVVALVGDIVVRGLNSLGPEFVPSDVLEIAPTSWDGRPIVPNHPTENDGSANSPEMLESFSFGQMFNTQFSDGRLKTEAWLSPSQAEIVGDDALSVLSRVSNDESVEVSIGAWVEYAQKNGTTGSGEEFEYVWLDVIPDHLAMLPPGVTGACSIKDGCGSNRVLTALEKETDLSIFERILSKLRMSKQKSAEDMSNLDIESVLSKALRSSVPGYDYLMEVFQGTNEVVYSTWLEDSFTMYKQTYKMSEDGEATLTGSAVAVEPITRFEPLESSENCDDNSDETSNTGQTAHNQGDTNVSTEIKELVGRLISNELSPFAEGDSKALELMSPCRLNALNESFTAEEDVEADAVEPEPTEQELMDALPATFRAVVTKALAAEEASRVGLIAQLCEAQSVLDESALKTKSTEELTELASIIETVLPDVDFSASRVLSTGNKETAVAKGGWYSTN